MNLPFDTAFRVFLADNHPIFLAGLRSLLAASAEMKIVGEATSATQIAQLVAQTRPDIAVVDVLMDGILVTEQIASVSPDIRVICVTAHEDSLHARRAFGAGARGYVLKSSHEQNLRLAIEAVSRGGLYVDPAIASQVIAIGTAQSAPYPGCRGKPPLTEREREVLRLIALGFTNREVAAKIGITTKSVETYKTRASTKLGIRSRSMIVRYAISQGWFHDFRSASLELSDQFSS